MRVSRRRRGCPLAQCLPHRGWATLLLVLASLPASLGQPSVALSNVGIAATQVFQWSVTKSVSAQSISIQQGSTGSAVFSTNVTQAPGPAAWTVTGTVTLTNPWSQQLQLAEVEVTAQFPATGLPPVGAAVSCPPQASDPAAGALFVGPALPGGGGAAQLACNFTLTLPTSQQGQLVAQANQLTAPPLVSPPAAIVIDPRAAAGLTVAQCALVTDGFDPASLQGLGPPRLVAGAKPPDASQPPAKVCASTSWSYTAQWNISGAAGCGDWVVSSSAVVNPLGGSQPAQSATSFLEVNACNSAEQAVPAAVPAAPTSDAAAPQLALLVTGASGGGSLYAWGLSVGVDPPQVKLRRGGTAGVTFNTLATRSLSQGPAPLAVSGAVTVANPTAEPMDLAEVEVSWMAGGGSPSQAVSTAASCPGSDGGSLQLPPSGSVDCLFSLAYASQATGAVWASAVTAAGLSSQSTQVPVEPQTDAQGGPSAVAACALVSWAWLSGGAGQLQPAGAALPPPQQWCGSNSSSIAATIGPLSTCGAQAAVLQAVLNPVGGSQSSETTSATATVLVAC